MIGAVFEVDEYVALLFMYSGAHNLLNSVCTREQHGGTKDARLLNCGCVNKITTVQIETRSYTLILT
jgi:hypothetical protein